MADPGLLDGVIATAPAFRLGAFELAATWHQRRRHGVWLPLGRQFLEVLLNRLIRRDWVVSRRKISDCEVCGWACVGESRLSNQVVAIRSAVEVGSSWQRLVETSSRWRYAFCGSVKPLNGSTGRSPGELELALIQGTMRMFSTRAVTRLCGGQENLSLPVTRAAHRPRHPECPSALGHQAGEQR